MASETPYPRIVARNGASRIVRRGRRFNPLDFYYGVLTVPVWTLLVGMAAFYFLANALFAGLYLLQPGSLSGASGPPFWTAFFMSVQEFSGTGLSEVHPRTAYAHVLASSETFCGLANLALMTGLLFDRVSRPSARIMFSDKAVITDIDGVPHFLFRAANQRSNQILEAEVSVTLACLAVTKEGRTLRRFHELKVARSRSPLFALSWTVLHRIDADSPFRDASRESLLAQEAEVVVLMSGVDETMAKRVHARHSYTPDEIVWGKAFVDVLSVTDDGRRVIDYARFHDLQEPNS